MFILDHIAKYDKICKNSVDIKIRLNLPLSLSLYILYIIPTIWETLRALKLFTHLILIPTLCGKYCYYSHTIDREIGVQRG